MHNISQLLKSIGVPFRRAGKKSTEIFTSIMTLSDSREGSLIFINRSGPNTIDEIKNSKGTIFLLENNWGEKNLQVINCLESSIFLVDSPRLVITLIMKKLYPSDELYDQGFHPTASIDPEAKIHPTVSVGPYCIIGNCVIGENSRILAFSVIKNNSIIGKNVIIREHCIVGGCGFGFVRDKNDQLERMPHIGGVIIEDNVELFPYVNVDRGTLGKTHIRKGSKIDHYSHIGHNTYIGKNSLITANTVLCGGSSIGNRAWVGVGSIIKENVAVGSDAVLGLGSVVINDVEPGQVMAGVPAKPLKKRNI